MIYNTGFKSRGYIQGPTQEEIYTMPEYFGLSKEEIFAHEGCPEFLKRILNEFPFDGRNNVIQVRPQDFRLDRPESLGGHWHTDIMVLLNDGTRRVASSSEEFHLMVCSWGNVVGTDFMTTPLEGGDIFKAEDNWGPGHLMLAANAASQAHVQSNEGELYEYTSKDIHRMGSNPKLGSLRLMIVAFDTDSVVASGKIMPSIKDKNT